MNMGVRTDPTLLTPAQHFFELEDDTLGTSIDLDQLSDWAYFNASRYFNENRTERKIDDASPVNIGILIQVIGKFREEVLKQTNTYFPAVPSWRKVLAVWTMHMQPGCDAATCTRLNYGKLHGLCGWLNGYSLERMIGRIMRTFERTELPHEQATIVGAQIYASIRVS
ncbi:hypothetical protein X736_33270 [Mesorhizobium sp. L2C089B000]|nr:hypothetical protein X736_33270 [Mesorhizobium sp. L2C089B000]